MFRGSSLSRVLCRHPLCAVGQKLSSSLPGLRADRAFLPSSLRRRQAIFHWAGDPPNLWSLIQRLTYFFKAFFLH